MNSKVLKEPVAQKRGFYIALYCILAALLVLAAVISYNNYTAVTKAREMRAQIAAEELWEANFSPVESFLAQAGTSAATTPAPGSTSPSQRTTPGVTVTPVPRPSPVTHAGQPAPPAPSPAPSPVPTQSVPSAATPQQSEQPPKTPVPSVNAAPAEQPAVPSAAPSGESGSSSQNNRSSELAPPIVEIFTEGNTMRWPVLGEVVMDYSSDIMVYDRTLEQFRTNDVLCIATDIGTPVHAAAGGVVRSVTSSRELGNTVALDHGNGWVTSYSQLQDGVLVKEGDVVNAGQAIGGVGAPSLYYVLLGNHLGFSVSHNDNYLDPKHLLE